MITTNQFTERLRPSLFLQTLKLGMCDSGMKSELVKFINFIIPFYCNQWGKAGPD